MLLERLQAVRLFLVVVQEYAVDRPKKDLAESFLKAGLGMSLENGRYWTVKMLKEVCMWNCRTPNRSSDLVVCWKNDYL
jgi:hypothetical protein